MKCTILLNNYYLYNKGIFSLRLLCSKLSLDEAVLHFGRIVPFVSL